MQIFLEPMTTDEVTKALDYRLIDGVNLRSDLEIQDPHSFDTAVRDIAKIMNGPVFVSITGSTADEMLESARITLKLGPNVVLKVKANLEGLKTLKTLSEQDISVNMTSIENPVQAAMALRAGAKFVTICNKKTDTDKCDTFALINNTAQIFNTEQNKVPIIVSGFESVLTDSNKVTEAIKAGANSISVSYELLIGLAQNQ
ncbi:transaldolase family protein [Maridesulfovibrio frigidus]|uniref:transaldolase family protein n=1 Tax=Maridesulfovibrio frigidus TaxID=340956 RepID=UPI0004E12903|nr:transaldolase family protein [Maridesulfovibrio frigidus]